MAIGTTRKLSCITRHVRARASVMRGVFHISKANTVGESAGKSIVTTMAFVTMTPSNATSLNLARNTFSPHTILQNSRGSDRFGSLKTPKAVTRDAA
eukprot:8820577-Ditylum_brightwellii.AAC.1